jgi:hypothetical protein
LIFWRIIELIWSWDWSKIRQLSSNESSCDLSWDTKNLNKKEHCCRNRIIWWNIFITLWRKNSFNNYLKINIITFFNKICLNDFRWLIKKTIFLKNRCLFSLNKTLTFHKISYSSIMISKWISIWKLNNFCVSFLSKSTSIKTFDVWIKLICENFTKSRK